MNCSNTFWLRAAITKSLITAFTFAMKGPLMHALCRGSLEKTLKRLWQLRRLLRDHTKLSHQDFLKVQPVRSAHCVSLCACFHRRTLDFELRASGGRLMVTVLSNRMMSQRWVLRWFWHVLWCLMMEKCFKVQIVSRIASYSWTIMNPRPVDRIWQNNPWQRPQSTA